jgi:hypothetical protein
MKTNESLEKPSSPMVLEPSSNIKSQFGIINPQEILVRVQAANPNLKLKSVTIWDDGQVSTTPVEGGWIIANTLEELFEKFSMLKFKTEAEKIEDELLVAENKANELRKKLAELSKCEKE